MPLCGAKTGRRAFAALAAAVVLGGCAAIPASDGARPVSAAIPATEATVLGAFALTNAADHPGQSGFTLLTRGEQAYLARQDLVRLAARSIDIQYYIWEGDTSGKLLAAVLLEAAGRGVRVRILIDDIHTKGRDFNIAALDAHPNVEIRTFNPFGNRDARNWNLVTDFTRLNHRMHNKLFIVDDATVILGGRNIGDDYFGLNPRVNFRDLDVLAAGPIVSELSASFDAYWNSEWALPITALADDIPSPEQAAAVQAELLAWAANLADFPYRLPATPAEAEASLRASLQPLVWAPAAVLQDDPGKAGGNGESGVYDELLSDVMDVRHELLIEVAYFIPTPYGVELLGGLVDRGAEVRVLTNSLATNDLVPGHAGYSRYREDLLRRGVELYEFRPAATAPRAGWSPLAAHSRASLHSKVMALDGRRVFIGSFNLNPRSAELNTEVGVIIDSGELASRVIEFMNTGVTPQNAWQLHLATGDGRSTELVWTEAGDSEPVLYTHDPETSGWQRFTAWLIAMLPVEKEL